MKGLSFLIWLGAVLFLAGGGGGGGSTGGGSATLVGRIVAVETGSAPTPAASIQVGDQSVQSDLSDGSFQLRTASGPVSLLVVYRASANSAPVSFRFDRVLASGTNDVGDLWVGPQKVTVRGRVLDAAQAGPLSNVQVSFAGRTGATGIDGRFNLTDVAYSDLNISAFLGIEGRLTRTGYLPRGFFPSEAAIGSTVTIDDLLMTSESSSEPPPVPFTIEGTVGPSNLAPGTVVTLVFEGSSIRQTTVGAGGRYSFYVEPGAYVLRFNNPTNGRSAPEATVTLTDVNQPIRRDATLQ